MSIIMTLENADEDQFLFPQLLSIILKYEDIVEKSEGLFELEGKKLEDVIKTLPKNLAVYDRHYQEMKSLEEWLFVKREKIQAKLWRKFRKRKFFLCFFQV